MEALLLTKDQEAALRGGRPVPLQLEGTRCIIIRQDVFDRVQPRLDDLAPADAYPAILEAWDQEPDPGLDAYQDLKNSP
jgi:hypothetical protein